MTDSPRQQRALWCCLHLPRLGLELFTRSLADGAAARPAVLLERNRVIQLNGAARARGLNAEMSLSTARSICAELAVAWRDPEREIAALEQLADWAWRFTPQVSLAPPDALLLELSGSLRLFRGLDRLQQQILAGLGRLGYSALPGMAPTPLAAQALARSGRSPDPQRLAAELEFPASGESALRDAWCTAVAAAARPALANLPLHCLERPEAEREKLAAMGLTRLAEVLRLPRSELGRRFDAGLLRHLDRLTGRRPDPRAPITPAPRFSSSMHFLEDVEHMAGLAFPMRRLGGELTDWLRVRQLATRQLDWVLRHPRHGERLLEVRSATCQRSSDRLLALTRLQLERAPGLPAVASLELRVSQLETHAADSHELFPEPGDEGADPAGLVDRLQARLGPTVCSSVLPADDHRPEHAWRQEAARTPDGQRSDPGPSPAPGPRPLWLLDPPRPLSSRAGVPFWHGPLLLCRGPERIDVLSWTAPAEDAPVAEGPRDYWVARHARGGHCWVFHCLSLQRWFLHGLFG